MALALAIGSFAAIGSPVQACEGDYTIRAGDTLSKIAARCDTTVSALASANAVDPHSLQLGQILTVPKDDGSEPVARESSRIQAADADIEPEGGDKVVSYTVRAGDTPAKIADSLGISLETLMDANEDLNPTRLTIGQKLNVPDREEVKQIVADREADREHLQKMAEKYPDPELRVKKGDWRLTVDLEADGFSPDEKVRVAVSDGSEWVTLGDMIADEEGKLEARARIPAQMAESKHLRWAVQRPWGDHIDVVYAEGRSSTSLASAEGKARDRNDILTVSGKIVSGGACDLLVTPDGESYALSGDKGVRAGDKVVVTGALTEGAEGCMGGHAGLEVEAIQTPRA